MHSLKKLLEKLGTIEPVNKPEDIKQWDKLGFIRGVIAKYRGKMGGGSDEEILDYVEKQVK